MIRLVLPWPPSANNTKMPISQRSKKTGKQVRRQVATKELTAYKRAVCCVVARAGAYLVSGPVRVRIDVHEPDHRRRDIANLEKAPIDALVAAGVIEDDCLIDDIRIVRHRDHLIPDGRIVVSIARMDEERPQPHGAGNAAIPQHLGGTPAPAAATSGGEGR